MNMELSRRQFMKGAGAGIAGTTLGAFGFGDVEAAYAAAIRPFKLAATTERSNAEDVDMVHAISEFQNKQSGYDAALKSYAMVQRLSMFQYING